MVEGRKKVVLHLPPQLSAYCNNRLYNVQITIMHVMKRERGWEVVIQLPLCMTMYRFIR
jgi:hypothetical protein